jgi:uncharacterized protein YbjT (DUF2867 family)
MRILVTGATGYIGGRLIPALLERGHQVRCLARDPAKLSQHPWRSQVEVAQGDVLDRASLDTALAGCDASYYLVHSMDGSGDDFGQRDRSAAAIFRDAAADAGLHRIVYLGGLGRGNGLSPHLASRQEVGRVLADGPVPVTELRAAVIIGSGSVSFEMVRHLTEVLPIMITPRWVGTRCQPIAIRNVLQILANVLDEPGGDDHVYEIGGPDVLTYADMMAGYAEVAGLRPRILVSVPVLTPALSSLWVGLVTPLPTGVARPLVESLRNEVVVTDLGDTRRLAGELIPYRAAVEAALRRSGNREVATRWDAAGGPALPLPTDPNWSGGLLVADQRSIHVDASPEEVFRAFSRIGGDVGYHGFDWAWQLRGLFDSLIGGVGLRRGRRDPDFVRPGEAVDFWRVAVVEPGRRLQLYAEMKLPGDAWLEWEVVPTADGSRLIQSAHFAARGLLGRAYWYALVPFHVVIFGRMIRSIGRYAEEHDPQDLLA